LNKYQNMPISIGHYLNNMSKLTDQWTPDNYKERDRQRIYLKDIDCPSIWHDKLKEQIPPSVFYLNESTGEFGGPGSNSVQEWGAARAGDLMSCLPPAMRADNMMCYIGHEGTYTPAHREMCASLGQNLMVETSDVRVEDGRPTKPGSSIWFMTETNDRHLVSEYWLSTLGHDIEVESHFAQINAWKAAPFKAYIADQRAGDFILIPPLAPHQVWNRGTRTMKAAWNRTTVETLEMALHEALPRARMVCRDEQYKNKAIIYFALEKYYDQLKQVQAQKKSGNPQIHYELGHSLKIRQLQKDFKRLFALYTEILLTEMLDPVAKTEKRGQYLPYDSFVTCSYCRSNIFNRFLTCTSCITSLPNGDEDAYDVCMDCYAMGRSCSCLSKYKWVEQFPWNDLVLKHDAWRHLIIDFEGGVNEKSPLPLETERKNLSKKTLAQVCQEQLKARPFIDPTIPQPVMTAYEKRHPGAAAAKKDKDRDDVEVEVDDEGHVKKSSSKKTRAEKLPKGWVIEHVSLYPEVQWKVAACSKCDRHYSYGSLFRMFDLMPQNVMEDSEWECPACLKICSCGACRKKAGMRPHEPTGTVLGHDTKKVADPRSVDSLVNFSLPNLGWIKRAGDDHPHESRRLSRRRDEAERAKARDPALDDNYVDEEDYVAPMANSTEDSEIRNNADADMAIDPMLLMDQPGVQSNGKARSQRADNNHVENFQRQPGGQESYEHQQEYGHNMAPIADMFHQDDQAPAQGFTSNGIAYEYPDPTMSQSTSTFQTNEFMQPNIGPLGSSLLETDSSQRDFVVPPNSGINGQQLTQLEQMLEDAKLSDRYFSTEARITGKSQPVTLSVSKSKLAAIVSRPPVPRSTRPAANVVRAGAPIILQSDFPTATPSEQLHVPKKKRSKKENDEDFPARKRQDRKPSTAPAKDTRKKAVKYTEPASDSEVEEANSVMPVNKPPGQRQLPKYIAQRTQEDIPSSPATLVELPSKDSPQTKNNSKTSRANVVSSQRNHGDKPPPTARPSRSVTFVSANDSDSSDKTPRKPPSALKNDIDLEVSSSKVATKSAKDHAKANVKVPPPATPRNSKQEDPKSELKTPPLDPALRLAEDNRKAKMKAMQWANSDEDILSGSDTSSNEPPPVESSIESSKPAATPKSIFSRPGVNGKKIKIVGAKGASVNGKTAQQAVNTARRSLGAL